MHRKWNKPIGHRSYRGLCAAMSIHSGTSPVYFFFTQYNIMASDKAFNELLGKLLLVVSFLMPSHPDGLHAHKTDTYSITYLSHISTALSV